MKIVFLSANVGHDVTGIDIGVILQHLSWYYYRVSKQNYIGPKII